MTNGQRTVAGMLAVVAVMLGLNLIVGGASAQQPPPFPPDDPPPEPTVVAGFVRVDPIGSADNVWRFWSDGTVDVSSVIRSRCDPFNACPGPPTVVVP